MLRSFMLGKIHKATVTKANLDYIGSVTIDKALLDLAGMSAGERVLIVDNTNGARLETYIIEGESGSRKVEINGAAAHLVNEGDEVIIITFALSTDPVIPKAILVDADNNYVKDLTETPSTCL